MEIDTEVLLATHTDSAENCLVFGYNSLCDSQRIRGPPKPGRHIRELLDGPHVMGQGVAIRGRTNSGCYLWSVH